LSSQKRVGVLQAYFVSYQVDGSCKPKNLRLKDVMSVPYFPYVSIEIKQNWGL